MMAPTPREYEAQIAALKAQIADLEAQLRKALATTEPKEMK